MHCSLTAGHLTLNQEGESSNLSGATWGEGWKDISPTDNVSFTYTNPKQSVASDEVGMRYEKPTPQEEDKVWKYLVIGFWTFWFIGLIIMAVLGGFVGAAIWFTGWMCVALLIALLSI